MTKIFVDAADIDDVIRLSKKDFISGITTNPTLMRKSGVSNFEIFSKAVIENTSELRVELKKALAGKLPACLNVMIEGVPAP